MKQKRSRGEKLLSRAYDKAAMLRPGQPSTLADEEEEVLLRSIRGYRNRSQRRGRSLSNRKSGPT